MTIVIYNCFHWIGYHYVNFLLEKGKVIIGVDKVDSEKKENLHMLVGRNSSFSLYNDSPPKGDATIIIGDVNTEFPVKENRIIQINTTGYKKELTNTILINAPILYGEWMDMTEDGIRYGGESVRFDSEEFQSEAVYIGDFVEATYPLLQTSSKSARVNVFSKKIFLNESVKLENSIYIHDNVPIEENIKKILSHYRRYKDLY